MFTVRSLIMQLLPEMHRICCTTYIYDLEQKVAYLAVIFLCISFSKVEVEAIAIALLLWDFRVHNWVLNTLHVSSALPRGSTMAWCISCTLSSTGWPFLIMSVIISQPCSTGVFMATLLSTLWIAVHRSPTTPLDASTALPGDICSPFSIIGSALMAMGILTCCPSDLELTDGRSAGSGIEFRLFRTVLKTALFLIISAFSALEVFIADVLYKFKLTLALHSAGMS